MFSCFWTHRLHVFSFYALFSCFLISNYLLSILSIFAVLISKRAFVTGENHTRSVPMSRCLYTRIVWGIASWQQYQWQFFFCFASFSVFFISCYSYVPLFSSCSFPFLLSFSYFYCLFCFCSVMCWAENPGKMPRKMWLWLFITKMSVWW